jgi:signal transduction histidine kinase
MGHGLRARGNGVRNGRAPAPEVPVASPGEHEAPPNGYAAAPGAGPITGSEPNGSYAGAGRNGAAGSGATGTGAPGGPGLPGSGLGGPGRPGGGAGRTSLKNWRVRSRLLLLIAIPTVTALVLGGVRIASATQSALSFQRAEERAVLAADVTQLAQKLETERDQTIYYISLGGGGRKGYMAPVPAKNKPGPIQQYRVIQAFYRQTDQAVAQFRALLAQYHGAYASGAEQRVTSALAGLDGLRYLRYASTQTHLFPLAVVDKYAGLINNLLVIDDQTAQGTGDPALSQTVAELGLVSRMKEEASQQRAILAGALLQGNLTKLEVSALDTAQANQASALQAFNLSATAPQREQWDNTVSGSFVYLAPSQEQQAETLQNTTKSLSGDSLTAAGFYDAMTSGIGQMGAVERSLAMDVINQSNSLRRSAVTSAVLVGIAVLLLFGLAVFFTMMVVRSMVRPLRRLRAGALEVAGIRLPETVRRISEDDGDGAPVSLDVTPIDVDSTDEIGEVARAFDQVHREAVRLASNEAALRGNVNAMFVNLSRRSQSLVERQIRLIDDLEQGEQDSERLANLFQMDHLATRMRRNSENLLVLAGHEVSRRWTQSVGLVDVLRAAVSEIEQYERVTLNVQPGIAVRGPAVNDVVHLLSELVENATSFSAAETPVAVSGHVLNSGGVLLDITDQGVGMGAEEMAHANWRLDNPPVVDVAVSRRMGLFVVARLAARHGIRVRLRQASMGGLTALVWLPDEVITHETVGLTGGFRRLDPSVADDPALAGPSLGDPRFGDPGSGGRLAGPRAPSADPGEGPGLPGRHADPEFDGAPQAAVEEALAAARVPRFTEGIPGSVADAGDVAADTAAPVMGVPAGVVVPPEASAATESRLPIFESVESDWFRRSRRGSDAPDTGTPTEAWSSPADEGWQAAEVAQEPVSSGVTAAGLPQRTPKANLVPGRAGLAGATTQAVPARSAAQTQERLASFQRAVREARAAAQADDAGQGDEGNGQAD